MFATDRQQLITIKRAEQPRGHPAPPFAMSVHIDTTQILSTLHCKDTAFYQINQKQQLKNTIMA